MKVKQILQELIDEYGLEGVFEFLEVSPVEALLELHEIGSIDLERLLEYYCDNRNASGCLNDEEQDDEG